MIKIRFKNCYPRTKVREMEICDVVLKEDKGSNIAVYYGRCIGYIGIHYSVLGTFFNSEGIIDFVVTLIINDTEYRAEWIREHFAEMQILLENAKLESLLGEF